MNTTKFFQAVSILNDLPRVFTRAKYEALRIGDRGDAYQIKALLDKGIIRKTGEEDYDREVKTDVMLMADGTTITEAEFDAMSWSEWAKYREAHGNVENWYYDETTTTVKATRFFYAADFDAITRYAVDMKEELEKQLVALSGIM